MAYGRQTASLRKPVRFSSAGYDSSTMWADVGGGWSGMACTGGDESHSQCSPLADRLVAQCVWTTQGFLATPVQPRFGVAEDGLV